MEVRGRVQGRAARKYAGFTYRIPIFPPTDIFSSYDGRVYPDREYPRWSSRPREPNLKTVDLADYRILIGHEYDKATNTGKVQLWMQPNEYTQAKKAWLVVEFYAANEFVRWKEYENEALALAFGDAARKGEK